MEVKRPLYTGQSIRLAGTGTPACASQMADDNAFSVVDLPAILDPVKIFMCFSSIVISTDALAYIILEHEGENTMAFSIRLKMVNSKRL